MFLTNIKAKNNFNVKTVIACVLILHLFDTLMHTTLILSLFFRVYSSLAQIMEP